MVNGLRKFNSRMKAEVFPAQGESPAGATLKIRHDIYTDEYIEFAHSNA